MPEPISNQITNSKHLAVVAVAASFVTNAARSFLFSGLDSVVIVEMEGYELSLLPFSFFTPKSSLYPAFPVNFNATKIDRFIIPEQPVSSRPNSK